MILSIIIPVYNEESTIIKVLKRIKENLENNFKYEVIVIDDGSSDHTRKLLEENTNLYNKLIINETNKGKGFSVRKGLKNSSGTHITFQDADLEYNPKDLLKLQKIFLDFDADGVIGSRFNYSDYTRTHNLLNKFGNFSLIRCS